MIINGVEYDSIVINDKNGETVAVISDGSLIIYEGYDVKLADKDDPVIKPKRNHEIGIFEVDKDFNATKFNT